MIAFAPDYVLWQSVAASIAPRRRVRPSTWSEENVVLTREMSPIREGPFDCRWKPWTRAIHDLLFEEPEKKGVIALKPAQIGFTRGVLNIAACYCDTRPGPFLFLISDKEQAAHFASEHFDPVIQQCRRLRESFDKAARIQKRRETNTGRPYLGGRMDFAGAGSLSPVTSRTYTVVFIDEYEIFMDNFPSDRAGSGWTLAQSRTSAVESIAQIFAWSHPRRYGEGIHELYLRESDQRHWMFDCPHCAEAIAPKWENVKFPAADDLGVADPDYAELYCPHCGAAIGDADRQAAVWPRELGGTGRFVSELEPEVADRRDYIGVAINRLCDPDVTVRGLAREYVTKRTDRDRMAFYNTRLGEPFQLSRNVLTVEAVEDRVRTRSQVAVPGGLWGVRFLTAGADVQAPKENPLFYVHTSGWAASGLEYVLDLVKLKGWAALTNYLRSFRIDVTDGERVIGEMGLSLFSIDYGYATTETLNWSRYKIDAATGRRLEILPLRYRPHVRADAPALEPPERKRIDPTRPHLGPIQTFDLHRHTWVDRRMSRFQQEDAVVVLCPAPPDFAAHMTANVLTPIHDQHGWGPDREEWVRMKNRRDDWLQAGAMNEAGAALRLGLDRIHERALQTEAYTAKRRSGEGKRRRRRGGEGEIDPGGVSTDWFR